VNTEITQIEVTKTWKLNGTEITEPDEIDHITLHLNRTNGGVKYIGSDAVHTVYDSMEDSGYASFTIIRVVNGEGEQRTVTWPTLTVSNLPKYYQDGNEVKPYTYFFVEEEQDGWKASYSVDGGAPTSASAATTTGGRIDIENTKSSVSLPSTGGSGTTLYYVLGTLLTLAAVAMMIAKRRRDY
jgi:LPXTG-motif cell wall-anchored protein